MSFIHSGNLKYYSFESLDEFDIHQVVFTRIGGVSQAPYTSLNLGSTVGDDIVSVNRNKEIALKSMGLALESLYEVWQSHGKNVVYARRPRLPSEPYEMADVLLTDQPGVTLLMRFADCVPVLLHDPIKNVVGLAHAGWKGTAFKTVAHAVSSMKDLFGSRPADIFATIGPSICTQHYEIGEDVQVKILDAFGLEASEVLRNCNGDSSGVCLDLWRANELILLDSGVRYIQTSAKCTACDTINWYSHRAENGKTGRFGVLISLNKK